MDEKLTLALVAACSAAIGALLTQLVTFLREWIIYKRANKALLREKYELLVENLSESISHKSRFDNCYDEQAFLDVINKPIEKIYALSILYFPELTEPSKCYYNSYRDYLMTLLKSYQPNTGLSVLMQATMHGSDDFDFDFDFDFDLVLEKLHQSQKNLYETIRNNASKYAK